MAKSRNNLLSLSSPSQTTSAKSGVYPARVRKIILDDKRYPDLFKKYGEWSSIGYILFDIINNPSADKDSMLIAKPLFPNIKIYPLENEFVSIILLPDSNSETNVNSKTYYYLPPVNVWNNIHHNAVPDSINEPSDDQKRDYEQSQAGAVRRVTDGSTEINLGETFKERLDTKSLLPFEGDYILEGRWGNSIRFGSTVNDSNIKNNWSENGENGDPIIILRNGQHDDGKDAWVPQVENINKDQSSIYITSNQIIPLNPSSEDYTSYKSDAPTNINKFQGNQIILNSGRLVLNSYEDNILLSSLKTINLNAKKDITFDTPKNIILSSGKIYLGNKNATEPLLLGNKTVTLLQELLSNLNVFMGICSSLISTPPGTPVGPLNIAASQMTSVISKLSGQLDTLKSRNNFVD